MHGNGFDLLENPHDGRLHEGRHLSQAALRSALVRRRAVLGCVGSWTRVGGAVACAERAARAGKRTSVVRRAPSTTTSAWRGLPFPPPPSYQTCYSNPPPWTAHRAPRCSGAARSVVL